MMTGRNESTSVLAPVGARDGGNQERPFRAKIPNYAVI